MTTSRFNPMTSASNAMTAVEKDAFDRATRRLEMLAACRMARNDIREARRNLTQASMQLDLMVAKLSEDSD